MNRNKIAKIISGILILAVLINIMWIPKEVQAVTSKEVKTAEAAIEKKYDIKVTLGSTLAANNKRALKELYALDEGMSLMPKGLVNKLSAYYKAIGKSTTVKISISADSNMMSPASYSDETNTVSLLVPGLNAFGGNGTNPDAIIHEFGHMLQFALSAKYGSNKLESEWKAFNKNKTYGNWKSGYDEIFITNYASESFQEDFAEMFMNSILNAGAIRYAYLEDKTSPLVKKSEYILKRMKAQLKFIPEVWMIYPQNPSKAAKDEVAAAIEKGIVDSTKYQYDISRGDFVDLLVYTLDMHGVMSYTQVGGSDDTYAFKDSSNMNITDAYNYGLIKRNSKWLFQPSEFITRKDAAIIIARAMKLAKVNIASKNAVIYSDCKSLPSTVAKSIAYVVNAGLMKEVGEGEFAPDEYCTYEQTYLAFNKLYDLIAEESGTSEEE